MGFLFDKYKEAKKGRVAKALGNIGEGFNDVGRLAYDISKDNPTAKRIRKEVKEEW